MFDTYAVFRIEDSKTVPNGASRSSNATKDKECNTLSDYYRGQQGPNDPFRSPNAAWQQGRAGEDFLADDPAQLGAQMQQGGVPLFPAGAQPDYFSAGDQAPTRVGRPITPPPASRRTAARAAENNAGDAAPETAAAPEAPVRRRRSRVAERSRLEQNQEQEPANEPQVDLFRAGDSIRIPPLVKHCWFNNSDKPAVLVFAITSPGL